MLYINSDNLLTLSDVYHNGFINDANVTGELFDRVTGDSLCSFTMTYVEDTNGEYEGVVPHDTTLTEDQKLLFVFDIDSDSYQDEFRANEVAGYNRLR